MKWRTVGHVSFSHVVYSSAYLS